MNKVDSLAVTVEVMTKKKRQILPRDDQSQGFEHGQVCETISSNDSEAHDESTRVDPENVKAFKYNKFGSNYNKKWERPKNKKDFSQAKPRTIQNLRRAILIMIIIIIHPTFGN